MRHDWSEAGADWRDSSLDEDLAKDWLESSGSPDFAASDVQARVLELLQTDLDPQRGWRLLQTLIRLANNSEELWIVGSRALSAIVQTHEDLVGPELAALFWSDHRYREVFEGQIDIALHDFRQRWSLDPDKR